MSRQAERRPRSKVQGTWALFLRESMSYCFGFHVYVRWNPILAHCDPLWLIGTLVILLYSYSALQGSKGPSHLFPICMHFHEWFLIPSNVFCYLSPLLNPTHFRDAVQESYPDGDLLTHGVEFTLLFSASIHLDFPQLLL